MKTIFRSACKSHFVQLPNQMLRDNSISLRARGLLAMVLTHQEEWVITKSWITEQVKEGKQAIASTFRELERSGYAVMHEDRASDGKITSRTWTFYDSPVPESERSQATNRTSSSGNEGENPHAGNPACGNTACGKPAPKNTIGEEDNASEDKIPPIQKPQAPRKRQRNELLDALALVAPGTVLEEIPEGAWSGIAKCLKEIRSVCPNLTVDEIYRRTSNFTLHFDYLTPSPQVLVKYWAQIGSPPVNTKAAKAASLNRDIELVRNSEAFPGGLRWFTEHSQAEKDAYLAARARIEAIDPNFDFQGLKR